VTIRRRDPPQPPVHRWPIQFSTTVRSAAIASKRRAAFQVRGTPATQ